MQTIQELAQDILATLDSGTEMTFEQDADLTAKAAIEIATFEPFATEYIQARVGCKGCHGN